MELPRPEREVAMTTGGSLDRTAGCVAVAILGLAVAWLLALDATPASANHVSCGDEITADTTLDSDLLDCPNHGLVIGADDITLDLNDHLIDGDGTDHPSCALCDVGLFNRRHDGVTVRDGSVDGFSVGVFVRYANHNRVLGISSRASEPTTDSQIFVVGGSRNVIGRNQVRDGGGIGLLGRARNVIARNQVRDGGGIGLSARDSLVAGNVVVGARSIGISLGGGVKNTVRRNLVRGGRDGFWVGNSTGRGLLKRNVAVGAEDDGFAVMTHAALKLTRNRADRNGDLGINALRGVIDGGGNRAHGNGDPAQCRNIACK